MFRRRPSVRRLLRRRHARLLLGLYLLLSAVVVLGPLPVDLLNDTVSALQRAADRVSDGQQVKRTSVEKVANVLMLVPIGLLLPACFPAARLQTLLGACCLGAVAVELAQGTVLTGREASVRDVLLNTAGAGFGLLLMQHVSGQSVAVKRRKLLRAR